MVVSHYECNRTCWSSAEIVYVVAMVTILATTEVLMAGLRITYMYAHGARVNEQASTQLHSPTISDSCCC